MNKFAFGAALAVLTAAIPTAASAQRLSPAIVAVVDIARVSAECNACRTAGTQIQQQLQQLQQRATALRQPLQTEAQGIQTALTAAKGNPDAALEARIQAYQTKETAANRELSGTEQNLRSIEAHVNQQIGQRLTPIINQVMQSRGASIAIGKGATLAVSPSLDVTADVLALLNQQLPSVSVTPLPQQAQPQQPQPQGR